MDVLCALISRSYKRRVTLETYSSVLASSLLRRGGCRTGSILAVSRRVELLQLEL
jgi:hypothetical protein